MIYYPIVIPTLNRFEHFKRCVESLSRNTHAVQTELIVGLDYPPSEKYRDGYDKIKEYVKTISGFKKVTILEREVNYGPGRNARDLYAYAFKSYDAVIFSEDDNEFSPCFLDFMDKVLNKYKSNALYSSVSGYLNYNYEGISSAKMLLTSDHNAWGMGIWRDKQNVKLTLEDFKKVLHSVNLSWKCFRIYPAAFSMLIGMVSKDLNWGDVMRSNSNALLGHYQIRPNVSLCRNWGNDGSGLHCGVSQELDKFVTQTISTEDYYDIGTEEPVLDPKIARRIHDNLIPTNKLKRLKFYLWILKDYLIYRLKN